MGSSPKHEYCRAGDKDLDILCLVRTGTYTNPGSSCLCCMWLLPLVTFRNCGVPLDKRGRGSLKVKTLINWSEMVRESQFVSFAPFALQARAGLFTTALCTELIPFSKCLGSACSFDLSDVTRILHPESPFALSGLCSCWKDLNSKGCGLCKSWCSVNYRKLQKMSSKAVFHFSVLGVIILVSIHWGKTSDSSGNRFLSAPTQPGQATLLIQSTQPEDSALPLWKVRRLKGWRGTCRI